MFHSQWQGGSSSLNEKKKKKNHTEQKAWKRFERANSPSAFHSYRYVYVFYTHASTRRKLQVRINVWNANTVSFRIFPRNLCDAGRAPVNVPELLFMHYRWKTSFTLFPLIRELACSLQRRSHFRSMNIYSIFTSVLYTVYNKYYVCTINLTRGYVGRVFLGKLLWEMKRTPRII